MPALAHHVGQLRLSASVADFDDALALRPRLERLAWELMPPVLEQVFESAGPADMHLLIARLDLDLGTVAPERLEQDVLEALRRALIEALGEALHDAGTGLSGQARLIAPAVVQAEGFESYLVSGRLPSAQGSSSFEPARALDTLVEEQPETLVAMLRRHSRERHVLERLLLQAGEEGFGRLLELLAPADAMVIVALLDDLTLAYRARLVPIPPRLSEPVLEQLLRVVTLEFLLNDTGSQFNRRRFLEHVLKREAAALGISYHELLRLLGRAVEAARRRTGFRSSLPVVLADLIAEADIPAEVSAEPVPTPDEVAAIAAARAGSFGALLALFRSFPGGSKAAARRLVRDMPPPVFEGLIERLSAADMPRLQALFGESAQDRFVVGIPGLAMPGQQTAELKAGRRYKAAQSVGSRFVDALAAAHGGTFAPLLDFLATYTGDRDTFVRLTAMLPVPIFEGLVRHMKSSRARRILGDLEGLAALHRRWPLLALTQVRFLQLVRAASLHVLLVSLTRPFDRKVWFDALIEDLAVYAHARAASLRMAVAEALAIVADTAEQASAVRRVSGLMSFEERQAGASRVTSTERLLHALAQEDGIAVAALRAESGDLSRLLRMAVRLGRYEREKALEAVSGRGSHAVLEDIRLLQSIHRTTAFAGIDAETFERLLWSLAVTFFVSAASGSFDRHMLRRHFAEGISRFTGHTPSDLAAGVRGALSRLVPEDREAAREFLADGFREQGLETGLEMPEHERARIERYLRTGEPYDAAFALPVMASGDRAWLAATVRRLARAVPGQTGRLIDRVFGGLLPQELVECLVPGAGARAARWLEAAGGGTDVQWRTIVSALLEGKEPPFVALSGSTGRRADRLVLLSHWLDHGGSVWWSPESETRDALLGDLTSLTSTETVYLFGGDDVERNFARLFRALDALRPNLRRPLLERLQSLDALPPDTRIASLRGPVSRQRLQVFARAAAVRLGGRRRESGEGAATAAAAVEPSPAGSRVSGPLQAGADDAQLYAWLDGAPVSPVAAAALIRRFAALADKGDSGLSRYLARQGRHAGARRRWASLLPPEALSLLMCVLVPGSAQLWTDAVRFFSAAIRQRNSSGAGGNDAARVWSELLELIEPGRTFPPARGLALLAERLSRNDAAGSLHLREEALKLAEAGGHAAVATALRRTIPRTGQAAPGTVPADATARAKKTEMSEDMPPETDDAVFIDNAGLVLLAPYLPVLFERLGLLAETDKGPRILGAEAMSRGVHLLQYMADGRCDQPEPKLVLNKVLCGLATAQPVAPSIIPSDADREICDSLIAAVIANWPIIANSSPAALRETFLGREGRLTHGSDRWDLQVQRKTLDVLVDQVPWSFGVIFHRWMPVPVHVEW